MIKRLFDLTASCLGLVLASPVLLPVMFLVWLQDKHSPFYVAPRVGRNDIPFMMIKLRSMVVNADKSGVDSTAANDNRITAVGQFIRRYKLDELVQLWNVLKGDMSLVGPRPCLFNQQELISHRAALGVFSARPGITGLAQIQGIDMSTPELLAKTDAQMLASLTLPDYFRYIFLTVIGRGSGDRVRR